VNRYEHFLPAIVFFLLSIIIDMVYIVFKENNWKKGLKIWRMGGSFFFVIIYIAAYRGEASLLISSGKATVIGMVWFSASFIMDSIADWRVKL